MNAIRRVLVGYGSESGNARELAHRLGSYPALTSHTPQVLPFNEIDVHSLSAGDVLLAVSSSFGDGEPPANAERFTEALRQHPALPGLRYAVFGLGDTGYPRFCGFTKGLDALLGEKQARPLLHRVDADAGYEGFFQQWAPVLGAVLNGDTDAGRDLRLQVSAYNAEDAFTAPILERRRLSLSDPAAWHVELDLRGSGMHWRAGDTLHVVPQNDPALLQAIADWYGDPAAIEQLRHRELRQLGKGLLRDLARMSGSETLKNLLKSTQRAALDSYLHGADLLDVLSDHASPDSVPLAALLERLSPCLPRAYSIASSGGDSVALCIREVRYVRNGRERVGTATSGLVQSDAGARVYCRSNPGFHLVTDPATPLLMVGTGTGIAPLMGLVQELAAVGAPREVHLVFGEKHRARDFLYQRQLQEWVQAGTITRLHTAFSRDSADKYYVQHALAEPETGVQELIARGAHVYVCGNKRHLEGSVRDTINALCPLPGAPSDTWSRLRAEGRLHCELY
ncbi:sulfite reductase flavoprotein subunit alpha [Stenotrophomonas sp. PS02289]|uniref:diflavin oxidoreductase n=1 Tax=Stenotrophomonas sp. PS02289 TaxID=2991422 RepID=UPI00249B2990|nr:sulfite reductase flavoprotein subunit alpha [Stenotrophomonas sp. PS02289]